MSEAEAVAEVATESIVDLFDSSTESKEVTEVDTETVDKGSETKAKEETQEADKDTTDKATAASEEDKEAAQWTFHAVKDERQKRQKAEAKLEELESKLKGDDKQVTPDIFEDQAGFVESMDKKYEEKLFRAKVDIYREGMIEHHDDYIEKETKFIELAKENPILLAKFTNATNPAKFAYEQMTKYDQFEEMQDIDTFKDKIRAELKLELEGKLKDSDTEKAEKTDKLSPSLAKARGSTDKAEKLSDNPVDLFD